MRQKPLPRTIELVEHFTQATGVVHEDADELAELVGRRTAYGIPASGPRSAAPTLQWRRPMHGGTDWIGC
jgi:hypothetical protein